jgi:hypothetical protein
VVAHRVDREQRSVEIEDDGGDVHRTRYALARAGTLPAPAGWRRRGAETTAG